MTIVGDGIVRVVDLSATKDLVKTATGFGSTKASKDGLRTRYQGTGTLTLDGSQYRVLVNGSSPPTSTHRDPSRDRDGARLGQRRDHPQGWRALAVLEQPEDPPDRRSDVRGHLRPRRPATRAEGRAGKRHRAEGRHHEGS